MFSLYKVVVNVDGEIFSPCTPKNCDKNGGVVSAIFVGISRNETDRTGPVEKVL